jgi:glycosyltransferase involved in cell wall biosynthesis
MAKVSIIVPSRNERFLIPTIRDIFKKAQGELEIVAVLDGGDYPEGWKELAAEHPNLHTIHWTESRGMRPGINAGVASAISRGAKYVGKFDAHCLFDEGFDTKLVADCEPNWVVVPRRLRLDAENWTLAEPNKPPIDYHYLSFPDDVNDFGGPGLNGKVWLQRAAERFGKPEYDIDDEMASQGSGWFMHAAYFTELELMDTDSYGPFWNESQEIFNKCWLSGGRGVINKKTYYAHLHKGSKYGRGYHLPELWLKQGATFTKRWLFNEAWAKQTLPFKTLIERFWPVPGWPENWEELVYGDKGNAFTIRTPEATRFSQVGQLASRRFNQPEASLQIHSAHYGIGGLEDIDVREVLQRQVQNGSLDIVVTNASLGVGNPFRGQKKKLTVAYSYDGNEPVTVTRDERDWLIIGQSARYVKAGMTMGVDWGSGKDYSVKQLIVVDEQSQITIIPDDVAAHLGKFVTVTSATALNDLLIRRFKIPDRRLRGPMPIELRDFHRDDLAKLFAELGFTHGAEIGVAEGKFSEVLCKANPDLHLLCVDPWHSYKGNPQSKTKEKDEFAYQEAQRRLAPYPNVKLDMRLSMDAVRDVEDGSLDFVNIDGHHGFRYAMLDLLCWSMKVRTGGIILLDDYIYLDRKRWGAGVVEAVQAFTSANEISPWFICDADRSVDAFFVKGDWK